MIQETSSHWRHAWWRPCARTLRVRTGRYSSMLRLAMIESPAPMPLSWANVVRRYGRARHSRGCGGISHADARSVRCSANGEHVAEEPRSINAAEVGVCSLFVACRRPPVARPSPARRPPVARRPSVHRPPSVRRPPSIHRHPSVAHRPFIAIRPSPVARRPSVVVRRPSPAVRRSSPIRRPSPVRRSSSVARRPPSVGRRPSVARRPSPVARRHPSVRRPSLSVAHCRPPIRSPPSVTRRRLLSDAWHKRRTCRQHVVVAEYGALDIVRQTVPDGPHILLRRCARGLAAFRGARRGKNRRAIPGDDGLCVMFWHWRERSPFPPIPLLHCGRRAVGIAVGIVAPVFRCGPRGVLPMGAATITVQQINAPSACAPGVIGRRPDAHATAYRQEAASRHVPVAHRTALPSTFAGIARERTTIGSANAKE